MLLVRSPQRISLAGGGLDYLSYLKAGNKGLVIGGAIDKYSYIVLRKLPQFFNFKSKFSYSAVECVLNNADIKHRVINALVNHYAPNDGLEMIHYSDLPGRCGVGSSSSFLACLLTALCHFKGVSLNKYEMAKEAIRFEQEVLKENVGIQDSIWAVFGGFNAIEMDGDGFKVIPVASSDYLRELESHLFLMYTGISRTSSDIAGSYSSDLHSEKYKKTQTVLYNIAQEGLNLVQSNHIDGWGQLLYESWEVKRKLSDSVSTPEIDSMYRRLLNYGMTGGKITGSGGGGMILGFVDKPQNKKKIIANFPDHVFIDFEFELCGGSRVVLNGH